MKEIRISFELKIALKQTDINWLEEDINLLSHFNNFYRISCHPLYGN